MADRSPSHGSHHDEHEEHEHEHEHSTSRHEGDHEGMSHLDDVSFPPYHPSHLMIWHYR
jgi:hypothetical protein